MTRLAAQPIFCVALPAFASGFAPPVGCTLHLTMPSLGFAPKAIPSLRGMPDLAVAHPDTIRAHFCSQATNLPGDTAKGGMVRAVMLVVRVFRDGRKAANSILSYLSQPASFAAE